MTMLSEIYVTLACDVCTPDLDQYPEEGDRSRLVYLAPVEKALQLALENGWRVVETPEGIAELTCDWQTTRFSPPHRYSFRYCLRCTGYEHQAAGTAIEGKEAS